MSRRVYNFSAGPATLPLPVLEQAADEMTNWRGLGASVMEISHRSKEFIHVAAEAEQDLRDLMAISDDYAVLFMQGGATMQFSMVPHNLLRGKTKADYFNTGAWSKKAIKEAGKYCDVNVVASSESTNFATIPPQSDWQLDPEAAYVHYTPNETIGGVEFHTEPETGDVPLVADMSSTILSRPVDVSKYGLIYAGAQKNIGPAGLTIVIVRKDLLGEMLPHSPALFNYETIAANDSMLNTPPTYSWYLAGLVFKWLKAQGGLDKMGEINQRKALALYDYIDGADFYRNPVEVSSRSWMNVPFILADANLDKQFLAESEAAGLSALKGHRSVGGMRASIYNAMPEAGVDALIKFMQEFANQHG